MFQVHVLKDLGVQVPRSALQIHHKKMHAERAFFCGLKKDGRREAPPILTYLFLPSRMRKD